MRRPLVFLLGTQRSGTTWLANIFDSHPECLHYYEPFAPAYQLFPYFPDEFRRVTPPADALTAWVRADLPRLELHRSKLFDPIHFTRRQFEMEAWLMAKLETAYRRFHLTPLRFAAQYNLLHLNRLGQKPLAYFPKTDIRVVAIKDVRLYFKLPFFAETLDRARFIHVVRHPAAVVSSMEHHMGQGRLLEIRNHIARFVADVRAQESLAHHEPVLARVRPGNRSDALAAYWRVANEQLEQDLSALPERAMSLVYEDLATDPLARTASMLAWSGLSMAPATDAYVRASSTSHTDRRTALDTNRVSATYYRDWVAKVSRDVLESVERVCADSPLMARFRPFYKDG
jgi:hypothetical protein